MSDMKYCPSCGTSLSVSAGFCHICGQKQKVEAVAETPTQTEGINLEEAVKADEVFTEKVSHEVNETSFSGEVSEAEATPVAQPVFEHPELKQGYYSAPATTPAQQPAAPAYTPPPPAQQPYQYSPSPYAQQKPASQQTASTVAPKKKKFPWIFTILWVIITIGIGFWAYQVLISPDYDYPILTEDAQRYMLLTAAIALVIYTLSLKLSVKKLKALPTVILIVASLVVFYFFCTIELTEGDWLHDTVTSITQSIIPTSGE